MTEYYYDPYEGYSAMCKLYARYVINGERSLEQVPESLKTCVNEIIDIYENMEEPKIKP